MGRCSRKSWKGQASSIFKKISLKPNAASHDNASCYTDTDGFLEHSPSRGSVYYKGPALQEIIPGFSFRFSLYIFHLPFLVLLQPVLHPRRLTCRKCIRNTPASGCQLSLATRKGRRLNGRKRCSGVFESILHFPQLRFQWHHVSSLQSAVMGKLTPWTWANVTNQGFHFWKIRLPACTQSSVVPRVYTFCPLYWVIEVGCVSQPKVHKGDFLYAPTLVRFLPQQTVSSSGSKEIMVFFPVHLRLLHHFFYFSKPTASSMVANSTVWLLTTSWCDCQNSVPGELNV